jgi:putative transposase
MTKGLVRYRQSGCFHFVTFSCYHRLPYLGTPTACDLFERSFETMRLRYDFVVCGYVAMPEHVHLLVSQPKQALLSKAIQALKLSVSVQRRERPFWQARYYDFNVHNEEKRVEKLRYIHRNPVRQGLVRKPEDWKWSSFRHYATGEIGTVEIESFWTGARRGRSRAWIRCRRVSTKTRMAVESFRHQETYHPELLEPAIDAYDRTLQEYWQKIGRADGLSWSANMAQHYGAFSRLIKAVAQKQGLTIEV